MDGGQHLRLQPLLLHVHTFVCPLDLHWGEASTYTFHNMPDRQPHFIWAQRLRLQPLLLQTAIACVRTADKWSTSLLSGQGSRVSCSAPSRLRAASLSAAPESADDQQLSVGELSSRPAGSCLLSWTGSLAPTRQHRRRHQLCWLVKGREHTDEPVKSSGAHVPARYRPELGQLQGGVRIVRLSVAHSLAGPLILVVHRLQQLSHSCRPKDT